MNYQSLLLWALTAFVICQRGNTEISLVKTANGIKLFCPNYHVERTGSNEQNESLELEYEDDNSGEYKCVEPGGGDTIDSKIYVKFRPCDNCVEIDPAVLAGLVAANVVATILAAATMYSIAAHRRTAADTSNKKSKSIYL
ncbi:T-cell surface glycoprotein CD3 delta chain-like [Cololabis saira]|uniref:T-cell surface glycoprotein CD3 delta chain-like n=1 Tax=Cololabis saira TaxID=129043 RepID=UPI002AD2D0E4|nr:T-cell surface glycoprotein CD3 delta chain-like [Cololabis saira]